MMLVGVGLLIIGGLTTWRSVRMGRAYRDGPWPGLSPAGAAVLLGCALLLAGGQLVVGDPRRRFPTYRWSRCWRLARWRWPRGWSARPAWRRQCVARI